jgi:ADP-dependent NAD(P)H-hydrate dehydratase / NAD(P)H-hydrate epimerase
MEMIVVTGEQMKFIEDDLFNKKAYRADIAMALAGYKISELITTKYPQSYKIAALCGYGNNGGDGFSSIYFLKNKGYECVCFFDEIYLEKLSEESLYFYQLCKNDNLIQPISVSIYGFDIIIDCILGIGIKGNPNEYAQKLISIVNNSKSVIVSADIPSGLSPSGFINNNNIVKANMTICMGYPKINTLIYPGKSYAGELVIADIGFPQLPTNDMKFAQIIDISCIHNFKKKLPPEINKYSKGHLLIIGGFDGMEGAAIISAKAALESGAGLITIATTTNSRNIISGIIPEVMTLTIEKDILNNDLEKFIEDKKIRTVLIGPGLGRTDFARSVVDKILQLSDAGLSKRLVIDGDALYHISKKPWIPAYGDNVIMTPHVGEAARLLNTSSENVKNDLLNSSIKLREIYNSQIILKGASTIIAGENIWIYPGGCNNLATAGSGDILAGFCAGISLNLSHSPIEAATFSVFCHGMSVQESESSVTTSLEIISYIKKFLVKIGYQTVA